MSWILTIDKLVTFTYSWCKNPKGSGKNAQNRQIFLRFIDFSWVIYRPWRHCLLFSNTAVKVAWISTYFLFNNSHKILPIFWISTLFRHLLHKRIIYPYNMREITSCDILGHIWKLGKVVLEDMLINKRCKRKIHTFAMVQDKQICLASSTFDV